jgi:hypothetical protein
MQKDAKTKPKTAKEWKSLAMSLQLQDEYNQNKISKLEQKIKILEGELQDTQTDLVYQYKVNEFLREVIKDS